MKLKIKGFLDLSLTDWDGKTTCVVFTPGCPFRCPYCYNRDLVLEPWKLEDIPLERILAFLRENGWGLDGVVITGGEPTIWSGLPELCSALREEGLLVKLDTNGTNPDMLEGLLSSGLVDYVAMDIKAPLVPEKYSLACGVDAGPFLAEVERSIDILLGGPVDYEFRTTVVPTIHGPGDVRAICTRIRGCERYVIQAFKPLGPTIDPRFTDMRTFTGEELRAFMKEAEEVLGPGRVLLRA